MSAMSIRRKYRVCGRTRHAVERKLTAGHQDHRRTSPTCMNIVVSPNRGERIALVAFAVVLLFPLTLVAELGGRDLGSDPFLRFKIN